MAKLQPPLVALPQHPSDYKILLSPAAHSAHPIIGFDAPGPRPRDPTRARYQPLVAWALLQTAVFVRQEILDETGLSPKCLRLGLCRDNGALVVDIAQAWNWYPRAAKRFLSDMLRTGLITRGLHNALQAKIGTKRERIRKPLQQPPTKAAVLAKTGGHCTYCGVKLTTLRNQPNSLHIDHVLAVARGGTSDLALLVPACADCNQRKGTRTLVEYAEHMAKGRA